MRDAAEGEDVIEDDAIGNKVIVFDVFRGSSRSLVVMVPLLPKATHCENPLDA